MVPDASCRNCLADTGRMVALRVRRSQDAERDTEGVIHDGVRLAHRGMSEQVHESLVLGIGGPVGVVVRVVEEVVPPQEANVVQHHSRHVLGHERFVLSGLATHDTVPE